MMLVRYAAIFLATIGILVACLFFLLGAALVILPSCSGSGATSYTACTSGGSGRAWGIVLALVGVAGVWLGVWGVRRIRRSRRQGA